MNEQCRDKAVERFMSDYRKKWGYFKVEDYNMDRHLLVKGAVNLYFLFKKQHFWSFFNQISRVYRKSFQNIRILREIQLTQKL